MKNHTLTLRTNKIEDFDVDKLRITSLFFDNEPFKLNNIQYDGNKILICIDVEVNKEFGLSYILEIFRSHKRYSYNGEKIIVEVLNSCSKNMMIDLLDKLFQDNPLNNEYVLCAANYYYEVNGKTQNLFSYDIDEDLLENMMGIKPYNIPHGFVICGWRHFNCIQIKNLMNINNSLEIQGFLTNHNRFVTRKQALEIAKNSGQISFDGENWKGANNTIYDIIFSEDFYLDLDEAKKYKPIYEKSKELWKTIKKNL